MFAAGLILSCQSTWPAVNNSSNLNMTNHAAAPTPANSTVPISSPTNSVTGNVVNAVNSNPKGTPTPVILDPKKAVLKSRPGATPTPGIPDPVTMRRQMQGLESPNTNIQLAPPGGGMMMMKKKPARLRTTPTP
jgi:hypothetical protein